MSPRCLPILRNPGENEVKKDLKRLLAALEPGNYHLPGFIHSVDRSGSFSGDHEDEPNLTEENIL